MNRAFLLSVASLLTLTAAQTGCAPVPTSSAFPTVTKLPDPFLSLNGSRVSTEAEWTCRREEIKSLMQSYELGPKPPKPSSVTATFASNTLSITASESGKSISFSAAVKLPSGNGPFPAIIALGGPSIPVPSNVAVITYNNEDIAVTDPRGQGKFYDLYGASHPAGGLMAWAWGASRILDALETVGAATTKIDTSRVGITGCSRNGKGAMVSGAFDDRLALTIPQEGGSGGPGCWRIVAEMKKNGTNVEDAAQIVMGDGWFSTQFSNYVNNIGTLPHDHHMLEGLVAPRGLLVIENSGIDYLGPISTYGCSVAGRMIFNSLGVQPNMGFTQASHGTSHCQMPTSQQPEVAAFIDKFLSGNENANTDVFKTDGTFTFEPARWINWTSPALSG